MSKYVESWEVYQYLGCSSCAASEWIIIVEVALMRENKKYLSDLCHLHAMKFTSKADFLTLQPDI